MGKKRKKQKYIAKIISDGKISKKEATKAVKKGITLGRIQNAQTKSFLPGNPFSRPDTVRDRMRERDISKAGGDVPEFELPSYTALRMKGKVRSIFDQPTVKEPEGVDPGTDGQRQADPQTSDYEEEANTALDTADSRFEDLLNQFKIFQEAAEERNRLAREAQRQQMLTMQRRERAAGRTPNLQIRGAGGYGKGGSQGFRRRSDQFRINPFRNLGGVMGAVGAAGQGVVNKMVNI